jgi:HK97 family phage major capsid protein
MNELLKLLRKLEKAGKATTAEKAQVQALFKDLDAEDQADLKEDVEAVEAMPTAGAASDDEVQAELEKGIKALVKGAVADQVKAATDAIKDEVTKFFESQKEAISKKAGLYHPAVVETRSKLNSYIRDLSKSILDNDVAKVKELTTDASGSPYGGYVVDSELSAEIRHLVTEYGVARREMTTVALSKNSYRANELVTDVTVNWVAEGNAIGSTQVVLNQGSLELSKLAAIVTLTRELLEDQEIDLFSFIAGRVAEGFAQKEDLAFFLGDGSGTYGSQTGIFRDVGIYDVAIADRTSTSEGDGTSILNMKADDLFDLMAAAPQSIRRTGKYYMNFSVMGIVRKLKDDNGQYIYQRPSETGPATIWGRPVVEVEVLPGVADDADDTAFVGYGDLKKSSLFGYRNGMAMDRFNAGVVRNVAGNADINLITTDREAVRWIERVGVYHVLPAAFGVLKTQAASA